MNIKTLALLAASAAMLAACGSSLGNLPTEQDPAAGSGEKDLQECSKSFDALAGSAALVESLSRKNAYGTPMKYLGRFHCRTAVAKAGDPFLASEPEDVLVGDDVIFAKAKTVASRKIPGDYVAKCDCPIEPLIITHR